MNHKTHHQAPLPALKFCDNGRTAICSSLQVKAAAAAGIQALAARAIDTGDHQLALDHIEHLAGALAEDMAHLLLIVGQIPTNI